MEAFTTHTGIAAPLNRANVDTDCIIPKGFLKVTDKIGLGIHAFQELRYLDEAGTQENPEFVLNQQPYRGATVLLARDNFGCGSSREHAPWALRDYGFRVIIAPSFADIFSNNSQSNGILLVRLKPTEVDELFNTVAANPGMQITTSLETQTVSAGGKEYKFPYEPFKRVCLLQGKGPIEWTRQFTDLIGTYQQTVAEKRPWELMRQ